jgi:hypothetical protein
LEQPAIVSNNSHFAVRNLFGRPFGLPPAVADPGPRYLKNVVGISPADKRVLMAAMVSAMGVRQFEDIEHHVFDAIESVYETPLICAKKTRWVPCSKTCETTVRRLMNAETASTAFLLRCITESVLPRTQTVAFGVKRGTRLTGLWKEDKTSLTITQLGTPGRPSRLIMGFGPSAAGKTHWATTIVELLLEANGDHFPTAFLSIDGGIYRACSKVYGAMVKGAARACVLGFDTLVLAGLKTLLGTSLFDSDAIKNRVMEFLARERLKSPISLYVPDTLGSCGGVFGSPCKSKYKKFIDVADDAENWIGLFIWQHKTAAECNEKDPRRKCVGCVESGTAREVVEGKKYSSDAYSYSMKNGQVAFKTAPGGRYKIHNCGRRDGVSLFEDYTPDSDARRATETVLTNHQRDKQYLYTYRLNPSAW